MTTEFIVKKSSLFLYGFKQAGERSAYCAHYSDEFPDAHAYPLREAKRIAKLVGGTVYSVATYGSDNEKPLVSFEPLTAFTSTTAKTTSPTWLPA